MPNPETAFFGDFIAVNISDELFDFGDGLRFDTELYAVFFSTGANL